MKSSVKIKKPLKDVKPAASAPIFKAVKREDASNSVFSKPVKIKAKVINNWSKKIIFQTISSNLLLFISF